MPSLSRARLTLFLLLSLAGVNAGAHAAWARSERQLAYEADRVWSTAVRFIRVDANCAILEKDAKEGYIIFEYMDGKSAHRGALELVSVRRDNRTQVRFVMTIADQPSYIETMLLDRLERKLREEVGSPTPSPSPEPNRPADADKPSDPNKPTPDKPGKIAR